MRNSYNGIETILSMCFSVDLLDITEHQRCLINHYTSLKPIPFSPTDKAKEEYLDGLFKFLIDIEVSFRVRYPY